MWKTINVSFVIASVFFIGAYCYPQKPRYADCESSADCPVGSCCILGRGRFSVPRCGPLGDVGSYCIPGAGPENATLHYPDNSVLNAINIHYTMCPCANEFQCSDEICENTFEQIKHNLLSDYIDDNDI